MEITILDAVEGERSWQAADRAAGAPSEGDTYDPEHYRRIARADRSVWARISYVEYWEALEVLPPAYCPGGFQVIEAVCTTDDGLSELYLTILGSPERAIASYQTAKDAQTSTVWRLIHAD